MSNITIPNLPVAINLNGSELIGAVQAGISVRISAAQIASLSPGAGPFPWAVSVGGTGETSFTQYALIYGNGTNGFQTVSLPAGNNYVLVGSPTGAPSYQTFISLLTTVANALPTTLPGTAGVLWNNGGVISLS